MKKFYFIFSLALFSGSHINAQKLDEINYYKYIVLQPARENENDMFGANSNGQNYSVAYRENLIEFLKDRKIPILESSFDISSKKADPCDILTCHFFIGTKNMVMEELVNLKFEDCNQQEVISLLCPHSTFSKWLGAPKGALKKGFGDYVYAYNNTRFLAREAQKQKDAQQAAALAAANKPAPVNQQVPAGYAPIAATPVPVVKPTIISDIDIDIPSTSTKRDKTFALVIGNEDYKSYQTGLNEEINVDFAERDAKLFKDYLVKTLGVPDENVILLVNAKTMEMNKGIDKLRLLSKNMNGQADLIFYYAGHGLPDDKSKEAYLIPVDLSGTDLQYGIKLNDLYAKLTENPVKRVSVFLDACFSGGARNSGLVAARGVKIKPKDNTLSGNVVVFSASSGDQSAMSYKEKGHGIFTYYLLKKIKESEGKASYSELADYVKQEVSVKSIIVNSKEQNPQVNTSSEVETSWATWKLKE
jgi:hypothetical protein